jgi:hypothetical protein
MNNDTKITLFNTDDLLDIYKDNSYLLIFVGSENAFRRGHIPNSIHIDPSEIICGSLPIPGKLP